MPPGRFRTVLALLAVALAVTTPASAASACPAIARAATVNAGCPCTPEVNATYGACESGFVCAQPWALQKAEAERSARVMLAAAGGGDGLLAARPGDSPAAASGFVCVACAYGQLCPRGASLPPVVNSSIQMCATAGRRCAVHGWAVLACPRLPRAPRFIPPPHPTLRRALNALACPAGFYCPTPASMLRCPAGYFCPPSTVQPLTCDMQLLISAAPGLRVPDRPATMAQRVFVMGQPLQGNSCPVNSSVPAALCPKGCVRPTSLLAACCLLLAADAASFRERLANTLPSPPSQALLPRPRPAAALPRWLLLPRRFAAPRALPLSDGLPRGRVQRRPLI